MDNLGKSDANTCIKSQPLEGMYLLDKKSMPSGSLMIHNNLSNRMALAGGGSFKFLPYQLSMVG
jgi:hypothetical protein